MNNPLLRKIATAVLAILVLIFIGYHIFAAKDGSLTTEIASYVDEDDLYDYAQTEGETIDLSKDAVDLNDSGAPAQEEESPKETATIEEDTI